MIILLIFFNKDIIKLAETTSTDGIVAMKTLLTIDHMCC